MLALENILATVEKYHPNDDLEVIRFQLKSTEASCANLESPI